MQVILAGEGKTYTGTQTAAFTKKIGSTVYAVSVHFSKISRETIEDKILHLIESEVEKTA